jgi:hypothetical protein
MIERHRNHSAGRRVSLALCALLLAAGLAERGHAADKIARCQIFESDGTVDFAGKCRFLPERGSGSFTLAALAKDKPLYGDILMVTVSIVKPGLAEVSGLTKDGINSRWGIANRSTSQRACWVGEDFKICAR